MSNTPWYKRARRWCQCNLTEIDARDCDIDFWRAFWKKNHIQGTIINAGGTVAYFASDNPYQYRAKYLGGRDLLREFVDAARQEGLAVMARMDINQATKELYEAKPDWFAVKKDGTPHRMGPRYITCVNGGYYTEQVPKVMREIIEKYKPDALGDNSWTGAGNLICYCDNCKRLFKEYSGAELPEQVDFSDRAYRLWLKWSVERRTWVWNMFNRVTKEMGGEDCLWMGMLHADFYPEGAISRMYDYAAFSEYGKAQMVDSQSRDGDSGFDQNGVNGMALHEVFGEDTLIIESMACYHFGKYFMRRSANAPEETRSWMKAGISGGLVPSPHFIGSSQDDNRMFDNCTPVMQWQKDNEAYLFDRTNGANIGLVWSGTNLFFHGQDDGYNRCKLPYMGMVAALKRGRMGYFPLNSMHISAKADRMKLLILPDVGAMSDDELRQAANYVKGGGSIVMTGATGTLDELGYPRDNRPLDELLGIRRSTAEPFALDMEAGLSFGKLANYQLHNYIRMTENRHQIFDGFEGTDIIELHGQYYDVRSDKLETIAYMVPPFPVYPPEFAYMDDDKRVSDIPAVLAGETGYGGRVAYLPADFDRRYADCRFPDAGKLLANVIRWACGDDLPFSVSGPGELDCKLYRQQGRSVLHILNHSGLNNYPRSVEEYYPVGRQEVAVKVGHPVSKVSLRCAGGEVPFSVKDGCVRFAVDSIVDQELIVIA